MSICVSSCTLHILHVSSTQFTKGNIRNHIDKLPQLSGPGRNLASGLLHGEELTDYKLGSSRIPVVVVILMGDLPNLPCTCSHCTTYLSGTDRSSCDGGGACSHCDSFINHCLPCADTRPIVQRFKEKDWRVIPVTINEQLQHEPQAVELLRGMHFNKQFVFYNSSALANNYQLILDEACRDLA